MEEDFELIDIISIKEKVKECRQNSKNIYRELFIKFYKLCDELKEEKQKLLLENVRLRGRVENLEKELKEKRL